MRYIYGRNPVLEALYSGREIETVYHLKTGDKNFQKILQKLRKSDAYFKKQSKEELFRLVSSKEHQGIVASVSDVPMVDWRKLAKPGARFLCLPQVQDPGNLGAVIRNAEHCGIDCLLIGKKGSCSVQLPSVAKSSAGAVEHLNIFQDEQIAHELEELRKAGFLLVGLEADGEAPLFQRRLNSDEMVCALVGSEGFGIPGAIRSRLDEVHFLEKKGKVNSLNLSSASMAAILWLTGVTPS